MTRSPWMNPALCESYYVGENLFIALAHGYLP